MKETKQKKKRNVLAINMMLFIMIISLITPAIAAGNQEKYGVLVIAHGSPSESWCAPIRDAVADVDLPYTVELGFLELVPNETINDAVRKLDDDGVTKIIAIPLFISSHSSHIQEIEYVLGLRETLPLTSENVTVDGVEMERAIVLKDEHYAISRVSIKAGTDGGIRAIGHPDEVEEELVPVETDTEILLTSAMDDHWLIADILADRMAGLSTGSAGIASETLVVVAHGTDEENNFDGWVNNTLSLTNQARLKLAYWNDPAIGLAGTEIAFIHHNATLNPEFTLRPIVESAEYPVLVPLMVSEGYFTGKKIPGLLENLTYTYDGSALTPHPNVAEWIKLSAAKESTDLALHIYDEGELLDITLDDLDEAHGHICPCVATAFKASLTAFEAWDGIPERGNLEIVSAHPSDGHTETFEYILNSGEDVTVNLPEGTDILNLTEENYCYCFIEKSSGDMVVVSVKENFFPDGFFELRKKCKTKVATPDEKSAFKLIKGEIMEKILYLPVDDVFEVEYTGSAMISPDELFESLSGEWAYEGSMTIDNDTIPISGTRIFTLTGTTSADFVVKFTMGGVEEIETGTAWWDSERKQLAFKEGDEIGYSNLTVNGYVSRTVLEDGILEFNISESVVYRESLTIFDDTTQDMEWDVVNMNGEILMLGSLNMSLKPVDLDTTTTLVAEVIPAISMTVPTTGVDFGKVGAGMISGNQDIIVVNTGAGSAKVSVMVLDDSKGFYNESLRLNGLEIIGFSGVVPADTSDFWYEYKIVANLEVPDWAGGKYDGTILFVAESKT
ncbi:MAG: sirohydrochlorin chelatase [Methanosarcinaceae archaeon]